MLIRLTYENELDEPIGKRRSTRIVLYAQSVPARSGTCHIPAEKSRKVKSDVLNPICVMSRALN